MVTSYMVTRINIVTTKLSNLACSTKIVQLSLFHVKILIWDIKNIISQLEMKAETRYVKSLTAQKLNSSSYFVPVTFSIYAFEF